MRVVIVRHGQAGRHDGSDLARCLTETGRKQTRQVAELLVARDLAPTVLYTSPLVRAVQTAEIVAHTCGIDALPIEASLLLVPDAVGPVADLVGRHHGEDTVYLISHEPRVRDLTADLSNVQVAAFGVSSAAVVDFDRQGPDLLAGRLDAQAMRWIGAR